MSAPRPPLAARVRRLARRFPPLATPLWQILGLIAANHVWTRAFAGFAATRPAADAVPPEIGALSVASTAGLAALEELVFRGALFGGLRRALGPAGAILGSAALFAVFHAPPRDALVAFLLGLQLGALRQGFGLGVAITAHVASNLTLLALAVSPYASTSAQPLVFALAVGMAGSAIAGLVHRVRRSTP